MTLQEYFWALPQPVLCDEDIANAPWDSLSMTWKTWSNDPIKAAALQAILFCQHRLGSLDFNWGVAPALAQANLVHFLHSYLLQVEEAHYSNLFRSPPSLRGLSIAYPEIRVSGGQLLAIFNRGVPFQHHGPFGAPCGVLHANMIFDISDCWSIVLGMSIL
jgi:hypothetical protein